MCYTVPARATSELDLRCSAHTHHFPFSHNRLRHSGNRPNTSPVRSCRIAEACPVIYGNDRVSPSTSEQDTGTRDLFPLLLLTTAADG